MAVSTMPRIERCDVTQCVYNQKNSCHALAITVGDMQSPRCDTFMQGSTKGGAASSGSVGACKVSICMFNQNLECQAQSIRIGMQSSDAECLTFKKR